MYITLWIVDRVIGRFIKEVALEDADYMSKLRIILILNNSNFFKP